MTTQELIKQVLGLPQTDRQAVAEAVLNSLNTDGLLSDEQIAIIDERLNALETGQARLLDGEEVFIKLKAQYT